MKLKNGGMDTRSRKLLKSDEAWIDSLILAHYYKHGWDCVSKWVSKVTHE
jgi:hypothetical protein